MGKPGSLLAQDGAPLAGAKVSGDLPLPLCYKPFDLLHHCFLGRAAAASHTGGLRGGPVLIKMLGGNEFRLRRGFAFGKTLVRAKGAGRIRAGRRPNNSMEAGKEP